MRKYTDEQKLAAVAAYRKGTSGLLETAKAQGVHVDSLRKWVAGYSALGDAGVVTKKRSLFDAAFKLEVIGRMRDEGLSCRQAAALYGVRRFDQAALWNRQYALHGVAALQPGWKCEQTNMSRKPPRRGNDGAPVDDQHSREQLLREVQQLRLENAYLKKAQALARTRKRSVPEKGR